MERIGLKEDLRIFTLGAFWEELAPRIAGGEPLVFDLGRVVSFDGAGFQFLLYLCKLARDFPGLYEVEGMGENVRKAFFDNGYCFEENDNE